MGSPTLLVFAVGYVQMYSWARTAGLQSVHLQSTWLLASCGRHCVNHCSSTTPQQSCPCSVNTVHSLLGRVCSAVSCLTTRGRQGVSLQFPLTSPSSSPGLSLGLPPHPPSFLFLPFFSLSLPFPFLFFLFFVCRTEDITITLRPEHRCNINGSLSLYFLSCLVNVLYFS